MDEAQFFPDEEYQVRLRSVRASMADRDLDACLISTPANIYYLTGLSHQGFFAYHMLILPRKGRMILIAREMERPTVEAQVRGARFVGYSDGADPAAVTRDALIELGLGSGRLGLEKDGMFLPPGIAEGIVAALPDSQWIDASGLVDEHRLVKSRRELAYTRQAAAVTDAMMRAGIETAGPGVNEREVAAAVYQAMIQAGGEYPGFVPLIRSTPTLDQEHVTWQNRVLQTGDRLFLEMAGCVRRYHAPMGRLVFVGQAPEGTEEIAQVCLEAFANVVDAIRPGVKAREVYQAWQDRVNRAGLSHYRRHHCGYTLGIGFPPSWVGGSKVVGLRSDSDLELRSGMVFHTMSWLMGTGRGDYFVSDTAVLTEKGCQVLTTVPRDLRVV